MSTISETVGKRLRIRRTELGYSQELTSEKAGLHPTYIGQVDIDTDEDAKLVIERLFSEIEKIHVDPMEEQIHISLGASFYKKDMNDLFFLFIVVFIRIRIAHFACPMQGSRIRQIFIRIPAELFAL